MNVKALSISRSHLIVRSNYDFCLNNDLQGGRKKGIFSLNFNGTSLQMIQFFDMKMSREIIYGFDERKKAAFCVI